MLAERRAFQKIFIMAPLQRESGRVLWNKHDTTKPRRSPIFSGEYSAVESTVHRYPEGTRLDYTRLDYTRLDEQ